MTNAIEKLFDLSSNTEQVKELLIKLKARCDSAKIKYTDNSIFNDDPDIEFSIIMPCGRETRTLSFSDADDLKSIIEIEFEKYNFLANYAAICSYKDKTIEAMISAPYESIGPLGRTRIWRTLGVMKSGFRSLSPSELNLEDPDSGITIKLKRSSIEARILTQSPSGLGLSIQICGAQISGHDGAVALLEKITNSLFFEIDIQKNIFLTIPRKSSAPQKPRSPDNNKNIEYPKNDYERAPMALYWYARSASKMPLLQFLAYYQAIEYFYPTYYNIETARRIKSIIKNPNFRADNESDLAKIISAIKSKAGAFVSEKDQLKATLKECLNNTDISEFLESSPERTDFFKSKLKGITPHLISIANTNSELYSQVADRLYDIRCKIVHTKNDDSSSEIELLLPYSKEAEKLDHDIDLVQMVAQKVLIYSSSTF